MAGLKICYDWAEGMAHGRGLAGHLGGAIADAGVGNDGPGRRGPEPLVGWRLACVWRRLPFGRLRRRARRLLLFDRRVLRGASTAPHPRAFVRGLFPSDESVYRVGLRAPSGSSSEMYRPGSYCYI